MNIHIDMAGKKISLQKYFEEIERNASIVTISILTLSSIFRYVSLNGLHSHIAYKIYAKSISSLDLNKLLINSQFFLQISRITNALNLINSISFWKELQFKCNKNY
jgi:hypothetical protein